MAIGKRELVFQLVLLALVFLFYSFDRNNPGFKLHQFVFFAQYALVAAFMGYYLMPKFLYKKQYTVFFGAVLLLILGLILLEETVLEPLFFPGTRRADSFPGVIFSLMGVLPVLTILAGFKFGWDALQKEQRIEALELSIQESELQYLRSQVNPHFLFNNLNNLYSYAISGSEKTPGIILQLSEVLRYMLYECKEDFVALEKELNQLDSFINLYHLQIEDRGTVAFSKADIPTGYYIAPLILVIFIENAFKHSQASLFKDIVIGIRVALKGDTLHFECTNNYATSDTKEAVATGIGLANVKKRLQLLYPKRHTLAITDNGSEYKVDLTLDLKVPNNE